MSRFDFMRRLFAVKPLTNADTETVSVETSAYGMGSITGAMRLNPDDLVRRKGLAVYAKMRNDEQVKAVCTFKRDAILSRGWTLEYDRDSSLSEAEREKRVAIIKKIIDRMPGSFIDALNGVSTGREFGFSMTEKVYEMVDIDGKSWVGLKSLVTRDPATFEFHTDAHGDLVKCTQVAGGQQIDIDLEKFIYYVHNPEFDRYFGQSELRAAYRSWYIKDQVVIFWANFLERFGGGFLVASLTGDSAPKFGTPAYQALQRALSDARNGAGFISPNGVSMDIKYPATTQAYEQACTWHDLAIARALLVPNLLGVSHTGTTGAFAQSQTQLEAFAWTVTADKTRLEACLTDQLIRDLGDRNWGDGEYPRFAFNPVSQEFVRWLVGQWGTLTSQGVVLATEEDEQRLRRMLDMPTRNEDSRLLSEVVAEKNPPPPPSPAPVQEGANVDEETGQQTQRRPVRANMRRVKFHGDHDQSDHNPHKDGGSRTDSSRWETGQSTSVEEHSEALKKVGNIGIYDYTDGKTSPQRVRDVAQHTRGVIEDLVAENPVIAQKLRDSGLSVRIVPGASVYSEEHNGRTLATYAERHNRIEIAAGVQLENAAASPHIGKGLIGTDFRTVLSHEIGHAVSRRLASEAKSADPTMLVGAELYRSKPKSFWEKNVSRYAGTNPRELMAEAFAAYTHPGYGSGKRLPRELERVFEVTGVKPASRSFSANTHGACELEHTSSPASNKAGFVCEDRHAFERAVERVNFAVIEKRQDTLAKNLTNDMASVIARSTARLLGTDDNLRTLTDNNVEDIAAVELSGVEKGKLKSLAQRALNASWFIGQQMGADELRRLGVETQPRRARMADIRDIAASYFEANGFRMAGNVSDGARAVIQQELQNSVKYGRTPSETRQAIWSRLVAKGFTTRESARTAETDEDVVQALDELWGESEEQTAAYLDTLSRTNLFEAMNEARYAEFTDPELDGFVVALRYSAVLDSRTTEICSALHDRVFKTGNDIWDDMRPPNHYNCRSVLIPITEVDVQRGDWDGVESDIPSVEPQAGFGKEG